MGAECCKPKEDLKKDLASSEKDILFQQYSSISDKTFKKIELTHNFLLDIPFGDYLTLIQTFKPETSTLTSSEIATPDKITSENPFFSEPMDIDTFQSFLENQIMKHPSIYETVGNKTMPANAYKEALCEMIKALKIKLDQFYNSKEDDRIKKSHIIILGLLYCHSRNIGKVKVFFDLFSKEDKLAPSELLNDFLLSMFVLSSYSLLAATRKIGNQYHFIGKIPEDECKKCLEVSELKDSINLLEIFNETFFKEKQEMTYDEVKDQFEKKHGFGWLFNTKGIRFMLEKNNVSQES